jgi:DNA polymerase-3 subunit alpha
MRIARDLGGFTMGEADLLRKAMGKKNPEVMKAQRERFVTGSVKQGINRRKAERIFELMEFFAGYGFNKSHSTTYALLAYQTGYLKANYSWHFMAALLTIESQNTEKLAMYLSECRDLGVPVLPPDVNRSGLAFTVEPDGVRFGLGAVKNVGEGAIASILASRASRGRLDSLFTLAEDLDLRLVNKRVLESLVKAGALDALARANGGAGSLAAGRARLFAAVDRAIEHGARHQRDRDKGQTQLFGAADGAAPHGQIPLPDAPPWTEVQQLAGEKEALGLYLSGHPIERHAGELRAFGARRVAEFTASEADVWIGGIVSGCRQLKTKKGDRMAAFVLDDPTGTVEVVVFPDAFGKYGSLVENDALVAVRGKLEKDDETMRLVASELLPIDDVRERITQEVAVRLAMPPQDRGTLEALAEILSRHRGDRRVALEIELRSGHPIRVRADLALRVKPTPRLVLEVEQVCGSGSIVLR